MNRTRERKKINKNYQHRLVRNKSIIINNKNDVDKWNAWFFWAIIPGTTVFDLYEYSMWRLAKFK